MKNIIYPGSFDPITTGHLDVIKRTRKTFKKAKITIIIANNPDKKHFFSIEERKEMVLKSIEKVKNKENIEIICYEGIISNYINENNISLMVRGLRNYVDMEYERQIEEYTNRTTKCTTLYFQTSSEFSNVSSSLVRNFIKSNYIKQIKKVIPKKNYKLIKEYISKK